MFPNDTWSLDLTRSGSPLRNISLVHSLIVLVNDWLQVFHWFLPVRSNTLNFWIRSCWRSLLLPLQTGTFSGHRWSVIVDLLWLGPMVLKLSLMSVLSLLDITNRVICLCLIACFLHPRCDSSSFEEGHISFQLILSFLNDIHLLWGLLRGVWLLLEVGRTWLRRGLG